MLQEEGSAPTAQGRMGLKLFVATCKLAGNIISSFCKSSAVPRESAFTDFSFKYVLALCDSREKLESINLLTASDI